MFLHLAYSLGTFHFVCTLNTEMPALVTREIGIPNIILATDFEWLAIQVNKILLGAGGVG